MPRDREERLSTTRPPMMAVDGYRGGEQRRKQQRHACWFQRCSCCCCCRLVEDQGSCVAGVEELLIAHRCHLPTLLSRKDTWSSPSTKTVFLTEDLFVLRGSRGNHHRKKRARQTFSTQRKRSNSIHTIAQLTQTAFSAINLHSAEYSVGMEMLYGDR